MAIIEGRVISIHADKKGKNCNIICALLSNINPVCGGYLISSLVKCYFKERMGIVFS